MGVVLQGVAFDVSEGCAWDGMVRAMEGRAGPLDAAAAIPAEDVAALGAAGLVMAPLPCRVGGMGMGTEPQAAGAVFAALRALGRGNLSVARLFEAHVNVVRLVVRFGTPAQVDQVAGVCRAGALFGLWVTDAPGQVLHVRNGVLAGVKGPGSGAGFLRNALVTVHDSGAVRMALVRLNGDEPVEMVGDRLHGMRASANGSVRLDGLVPEFVGNDGDYMREPDFSTGAWRTMAATVGGMEALLAAVQVQLMRRGHDGFALQQARFGEMAIAVETARLWTWEAGQRSEAEMGAAADLVVYVNLARIAVEAACLALIQGAQRGLGLGAFVRPNPVERLLRDLAVYLRQPAADLVLTEAGLHLLRA